MLSNIFAGMFIYAARVALAATLFWLLFKNMPIPGRWDWWACVALVVFIDGVVFAVHSFRDV